MKKSFVAVLLAVSFAASVFASEWGGIIKDDTSVSNPSIDTMNDPKAYDINQSNSVYFWLNSQFGDYTKWYFVSEAMYKYKLAFDNGAMASFTNLVDLDLLKISGRQDYEKGVLNVAMGRYSIFDNSGIVFAQVCDGVSVKYSFPALSLSIYGGYTGLLNALNVSMLDETGIAQAKIGNTKQVYSLSHPYIPVIASVEMPTRNNQLIGLQFSTYLDLKTPEATAENPNPSRYNRYYANFMLKGPISGSLYYSLTSTFGFPNFKEVSNYTNFAFMAYGGSTLAVYVGAQYASGDNGFLKPFRGVSSMPCCSSLAQPETTGVFIPNLRVIFGVKKATIETSAKAIFGCPSKNMSFTGAEVGLNAVVNLFSDLQLGFNVKGYMDLAPKQKDEYGVPLAGNSYYTAAINLTFAF